MTEANQKPETPRADFLLAHADLGGLLAQLKSIGWLMGEWRPGLGEVTGETLNNLGGLLQRLAKDGERCLERMEESR